MHEKMMNGIVLVAMFAVVAVGFGMAAVLLVYKFTEMCM